MDVCHLGAPVENITKMLKEIEGEAWGPVRQKPLASESRQGSPKHGSCRNPNVVPSPPIIGGKKVVKRAWVKRQSKFLLCMKSKSLKAGETNQRCTECSYFDFCLCCHTGYKYLSEVDAG